MHREIDFCRREICEPPLHISQVAQKIEDSYFSLSSDWEEILKLEGRLEELFAFDLPDLSKAVLLKTFMSCHTLALASTGLTEHALSIARLGERRIEILGKMERFWDQGEAMCLHAASLLHAHKRDEGARWYQQARDFGALHGFFSVGKTP